MTTPHNVFKTKAGAALLGKVLEGLPLDEADEAILAQAREQSKAAILGEEATTADSNSNPPPSTTDSNPNG